MKRLRLLNPIWAFSYFFIFPVGCQYHFLKQGMFLHAIINLILSVYGLIPYIIISIYKDVLLGLILAILHTVLSIIFSIVIDLYISFKIHKLITSGGERSIKYSNALKSLNRELMDCDLFSNPIWTSRIITRKIYFTLFFKECDFERSSIYGEKIRKFPLS